MTENIKMDIYNFQATSGIPPASDEPTRRDGYKWSPTNNQWVVDPSQSQTKRFEIMRAQGNQSISMLDIYKERQLDGFCQRLTERNAQEQEKSDK